MKGPAGPEKGREMDGDTAFREGGALGRHVAVFWVRQADIMRRAGNAGEKRGGWFTCRFSVTDTGFFPREKRAAREEKPESVPVTESGPVDGGRKMSGKRFAGRSGFQCRENRVTSREARASAIPTMTTPFHPAICQPVLAKKVPSVPPMKKMVMKTVLTRFDALGLSCMTLA